MYLTTDDNSSTYVKQPSHKQQQADVEVSIGTNMLNEKVNSTTSPDESTMDSSTASSSSTERQDGRLSNSDSENSNTTKPCHWVGYKDGETETTEVTEDLSMEIDCDEEEQDDVSMLNSSIRTLQVEISSEYDQTPFLVTPEEVDISCCEPGAIEVAVAWDSFQNMVTYVTPTLVIPATKTTTTKTITKKSRRKRSSRKHRGRLLSGSTHSSMMTWDLDFPLRSHAEDYPGVVRSADI
ncbi:unnamed protein product [Cylindrotheca closterium]|uniref:Uncharacterized protein n=1 Tax=Cylindrotheca closterium TaxID=2856 RepID=A0AAD2FYR6_9STRA|nr:unnamed protein product [Cylindrotheca closterium]